MHVSAQVRDLSNVAELVGDCGDVTELIVDGPAPSGWASIGPFPALTTLKVRSWVGRLDFARFPALETLHIGAVSLGFESLTTNPVPPLTELSVGSLRAIDLSGLASFGLRHLTITDSPRFERLDGIEAMADTLESMVLARNTNLISLAGVESCPRLADLTVEACSKITNLDPVADSTSLRRLRLIDNPNVLSLDALSEHPSIETLDIVGMDYLY